MSGEEFVISADGGGWGVWRKVHDPMLTPRFWSTEKDRCERFVRLQIEGADQMFIEMDTLRGALAIALDVASRAISRWDHLAGETELTERACAVMEISRIRQILEETQ